MDRGESHAFTSSEELKANSVIIGIGSNINAETNISKMMELLGKEVMIVRVSSLLKTKAIGIKKQPEFTNGAVMIETPIEKDELRNLLKRIEDRLGRDRTVSKYGPRTIDLDIVVWNGEIVDKDYYSRDFLRKSVREVAEPS